MARDNGGGQRGARLDRIPLPGLGFRQARDARRFPGGDRAIQGHSARSPCRLPRQRPPSGAAGAVACPLAGVAAVSIVTISQALGSAGEAIARALAEELTYTLADREIILKAAERLG